MKESERARLMRAVQSALPRPERLDRVLRARQRHQGARAALTHTTST